MTAREVDEETSEPTPGGWQRRKGESEDGKRVDGRKRPLKKTWSEDLR